MARWKITEAHYLNVEGTKWEYSEVDRKTGRPKRTQFNVPLYINPKYEDDLKAFGQGDPDPEFCDIIVSDGHNAQPKDIIFTGPPTPDMIPLDDKAKAISEKMRAKWNAPEVEGLSFSQRMELGFINQMAELREQVKQVPQAEGLKDLMETMAAMMKQQTEILAALASQRAEPSTSAPGSATRRKVA